LRGRNNTIDFLKKLEVTWLESGNSESLLHPDPFSG
jgi:hypothetical protein